MRHGKKNNSLTRKSAHRKAMLSNMACSLIEHKKINTTVAKAKALRGYLEPLLTKSKTDSTHSRRIVFKYLRNKEAITELYRVIAPKIADRPGGYLRIIRLGNRLGDNAEMCMIELVDFNEVMNKVEDPKQKPSRRSRTRRGGSAKTEATSTAASSEEKTSKKGEDSTDKKEVSSKESSDSKSEVKAETPKAKVEKKEEKSSKTKEAESPVEAKKKTPAKQDATVSKEEKKTAAPAKKTEKKTTDKKDASPKEDKDESPK